MSKLKTQGKFWMNTKIPASFLTAAKISYGKLNGVRASELTWSLSSSISVGFWVMSLLLRRNLYCSGFTSVWKWVLGMREFSQSSKLRSVSDFGAYLMCWSFERCLRVRCQSWFYVIKLTAALVIDTTLHPDTGKKIPALFRISAFVPANIVICMGILLPGGGVCSFFSFPPSSI